MKRTLILAVFLALSLLLCSHQTGAAAASPEWITRLPAARNAQQLIVVAGVGQTTAWISMHVNTATAGWQQIMTTPGFIGKNGLGKEREGDNKTPVGTFHFTKAFGLAPDPGCAIPYTQVDENYYWSGDPNLMYNQMIDIRRSPQLNTASSEHLSDYNPHYIYVLDMGYNVDCVPGRGSALFMHCLSDKKPFTGGCVAIPEDKMKFVLQNISEDCLIVIDSLENLGGSF